MASEDPTFVTDLQLEVLRILWSAGEATVNEVHRELQSSRELAPTTVATLLGRLEKRGLVSHTIDGRQYRYSAAVEESDIVRAAVDEVATRVFGGDLTAFAAQLLSGKDVKPDDLARIRALIDERMSESN